MRRSTALMAQWKTEEKEGTSLHFEACKGGYFSDREEYGLKVVGKTEQNGIPTPDAPIPISCVKAGTKIRACGKNLFCYANSSYHGAAHGITVDYDSQTQTFTINGTAGAMALYAQRYINIPVDPTKEYALSVHYISGTVTGNEVYAYFGRSNTAGSYENWRTVSLKASDSSTVSTVGKSYISAFWFFMTAGMTFTDYKCRIQVEDSAEATSFAPYCGSEITVPCDLYKDDAWYPASGKVVRQNRSITFDGSKSFGYADGWGMYDGFRYTLNPIGKRHDYWTVFDGACNYYKKVTSTHQSDNANSDVPPSISTLATSEGLLQIHDHRYNNDLAGFNAYIASLAEGGNPLQVVYRLNAPVIEQYPPQKLSAPSGEIHVIQIPTNINANLSATMMGKKGEYYEIRETD